MRASISIQLDPNSWRLRVYVRVRDIGEDALCYILCIANLVQGCATGWRNAMLDRYFNRPLSTRATKTPACFALFVLFLLRFGKLTGWQRLLAFRARDHGHIGGRNVLAVCGW